MSTSDASDIKAVRRAEREAERAARAQRKADAARERALEAARAGGLFDGMQAAPVTDPADQSTSPTSGTAPADAVADPAQPQPGREPMDPARRRLVTRALAVAAVVLLVITGLASWQYVEARQDTTAAQAVADVPGQATDAAREIATQMFTYDHRTVDADLAAVRGRLTTPALEEFVEESMPTVSSAAKTQEATVYATVAAAAPQEVGEDRVTVLVMLNRMVSTKEAPEAAASASRLSLDMVREDGEWKLAELTSL